MPWLLIQNSSPKPAKAAEPPASPSGEIWVFLGGLNAALYQSGYISEMLAAGRRPALLVGAGFGAVNAILASTWAASSFTAGWERLRGRHFVMSAALDEAGGLPSRFGTQEAISSAAKHAVGFVTSHADVKLVTGERFLACGTAEGSRIIDLLGPALRRTDVEPDTIAAAVTAAAAGPGTDVTVWGADEWTASSPLVLKALDEAGKGGTRVIFARHYCGPEPTLLEMLLPGSGAVERLTERGRSAAIEDLERVSA